MYPLVPKVIPDLLAPGVDGVAPKLPKITGVPLPTWAIWPFKTLMAVQLDEPQSTCMGTAEFPVVTFNPLAVDVPTALISSIKPWSVLPVVSCSSSWLTVGEPVSAPKVKVNGTFVVVLPQVHVLVNVVMESD